jgi:hypothetical protein
MKNMIIKKYTNLYNACKNNPTIILNVNSSPKLYIEPKQHKKNGFIEKFCNNKVSI